MYQRIGTGWHSEHPSVVWQNKLAPPNHAAVFCNLLTNKRGADLDFVFIFADNHYQNNKQNKRMKRPRQQTDTRSDD